MSDETTLVEIVTDSPRPMHLLSLDVQVYHKLVSWFQDGKSRSYNFPASLHPSDTNVTITLAKAHTIAIMRRNDS